MVDISRESAKWVGFIVRYGKSVDFEAVGKTIKEDGAPFPQNSRMEYAGVYAVTAVVIALLISAQVQKNVNAKGGCPECGTPVPRFRRPTSFRQAIWGGWTCANCGTEMNWHGEEIRRSEI